MAGDNATLNMKNETVKREESSYVRSTISFPYFDLDEAMRIAKAIGESVGKGECTDDQLAAWLNLSSRSSGFRSRISAARMFGLIEPGKTNDHRLTDLGFKATDETRQRVAKADAFLNVELFRRVYEQWRGMQLPPGAALERRMMEMGVAEKQTARARQVLERSAKSAGFFEHGRDKLVRPAVKGGDTPPPKSKPPVGGSRGGGGGPIGGDENVDPIIAGLLQRLPPSGSVWAEDERNVWLELLKGSFKLIYRDSETPGKPDPTSEINEDDQ